MAQAQGTPASGRWRYSCLGLLTGQHSQGAQAPFCQEPGTAVGAWATLPGGGGFSGFDFLR